MRPGRRGPRAQLGAPVAKSRRARDPGRYNGAPSGQHGRTCARVKAVVAVDPLVFARGDRRLGLFPLPRRRHAIRSCDAEHCPVYHQHRRGLRNLRGAGGGSGIPRRALLAQPQHRHRPKPQRLQQLAGVRHLGRPAGRPSDHWREPPCLLMDRHRRQCRKPHAEQHWLGRRYGRDAAGWRFGGRRGPVDGHCGQPRQPRTARVRVFRGSSRVERHSSRLGRGRGGHQQRRCPAVAGDRRELYCPPPR